ncbi:Structural maintenance of chromosomes 4-like 1 protein isoform 3-like protein [Camelus ferus]|nr:Structural maintenance of chromosomes 4-like 1 protein isoform 3-like protein [Camelus ferus]
MTNEAGAPRLMITHIVNQNFKSYAGEKILGPFHKRFSCIIGPNGSGKSNVIDSMLFVFGYRAQKIRSKKLSVLIHNSDEHKDIQSCTVEVHFQKIIDKEGDDYEVVPNSNFYVSRTAYRDNTSVYHISGKKKTFKDVGNLLRSHGIDLDHNRFLILQFGSRCPIVVTIGVNRKLNKITKFIEENKEKFTKLDLEDVQVREKLKHATSKAKKLEKQLQKDKEKVEEFKGIPAKSENIITEATTRNNALEKEKEKEEEKLKEVMDNLKQETQGLQKEKESREKELMGFSKLVNEARSKMDVAQSELDIYLSRHNTAVSQLSKAKEALMAASETLKERKAAIGDIEAKLPQTESELKEVNKMELQLQRDSQKAVQIQEQKVQLEEAVVKLRHSEREMRNTLEKFTASIQRLSEQEEYLNVQVKELEANVLATAPDKRKQKLLEENVSAFKTEYDNVAERAGKVEAEVKRLHNIIVEINNHKLKAQQDKLDKINKQLDECASAITKAQVAIKTADRNLKKAQDSVFRTEKEIKDTEKEVNDLTAELKSLEDKATEVIKNTNAAEIAKISLHPIEDNPVEEILVLSPEDLEAIKNPDSITNQIALLEAQCHEMKPNLGAIAEYKKKEELYLQRVAELDRITNERDNFRQAYEDLRKQRLNEFMAGFYVITNKLKENYQMLTLGGDAELELVDSLDPFSEGIMFSVRPPKKSWKKIFNLSGGEKTLSSLALVFALHHYKPTPLYFMDEIDAALDFKNVSIVAFYIYEQTKNAQFIIISLRNNMFEISDRLIGIYKTYNITKSVAVNPKEIASKGLC